MKFSHQFYISETETVNVRRGLYINSTLKRRYYKVIAFSLKYCYSNPRARFTSRKCSDSGLQQKVCYNATFLIVTCPPLPFQEKGKGELTLALTVQP